MENTTHTNPIVIIVTLVIGVGIGYLIGVMTADTAVGTSIQTVAEYAEQNIEENIANSNDDESEQVDSTLVAGDEAEPAFVIQVDSLTSAQQTMVRTAGVSGDSIIITKGMVACAEAEIGAPRVVEIQNGAEISMSEGIILVGCYTSN